MTLDGYFSSVTCLDFLTLCFGTRQSGEVGTTTVLPVQERSDIACLKDYIDVFLPVDILPAGRNLTWRDEDCRVDFNGTHYTDKLPFSECGTTIKMENDTVTFMNDLIVRINRNTDAAIYELYEYRDDDVTYGDDYETIIPVQCVYPRTGSVSTSYAPIRQNIRFFEKRYGQLDVKMEQFVSADYSEIVPSGEYPRKISLDDDVFIRVALGFERGDLQLRADNCIATATPSPSDAKWRQLIEKGCPENRVRLLSVKESRDVKFTFKAFDFRHDSTGFVYVHCEVAVCSPSDNACAMGCDARAKRALAPDWISGSHLVSTGPLLVSRPTEDSKSESFTMPILIAGTSMLVAAIAVVLAIVGWTRKPSLQNDVRLT